MIKSIDNTNNMTDISCVEFEELFKAPAFNVDVTLTHSVPF